MTPCRVVLLIVMLPFGLLSDIALPPWPLQGDPATLNAPPAPTNFSAVQLTNAAVLSWSTTAPFVLILRAMSNAVLRTWDGYQPLAIVAAPQSSFSDLENFTVPPPPPRIINLVLTATNEVVTLTRPVGLQYWLARSTNLVSWEFVPIAIPGSADAFVYQSDSRVPYRFYRAGAPHGAATYHYVIMGIDFLNPIDQLTYDGPTTLLSGLGLDAIPPFTHSDWVFLLNFTAL